MGVHVWIVFIYKINEDCFQLQCNTYLGFMHLQTRCSCCLVFQTLPKVIRKAQIDRQSIFYKLESSSSIFPRKRILLYAFQNLFLILLHLCIFVNLLFSICYSSSFWTIKLVQYVFAMIPVLILYHLNCWVQNYHYCAI